MRHGCLLNSLFWGVVLILIGAALLLNVAFGIHLPIFELFLALIFFYIGLRILVGWRRWGGRRRSRWQEDGRVDAAGTSDRHEVLFGRGDIDLTGIVLGDKVQRVEVSTVFGESKVIIDAKMPVKIRASSAFGAVRLPDGQSVTFGDHVWKSPGFDGEKPYLLVDVSAVFGACQVVVR